MYTRFGGRLSQGQNLASNREGEKSTGREREKEREEHIAARARAYSFCCGPIQLKHECALNQHDSGEKVKQESHAGNTKASRGKPSSLLWRLTVDMIHCVVIWNHANIGLVRSHISSHIISLQCLTAWYEDRQTSVLSKTSLNMANVGVRADLLPTEGTA